MMEFLRSLQGLDLKKRCLFCLARAGSKYGNAEEEEEVLRQIFSKGTADRDWNQNGAGLGRGEGGGGGGFQRFFWRLLVGSGGFQSSVEASGGGGRGGGGNDEEGQGGEEDERRRKVEIGGGGEEDGPSEVGGGLGEEASQQQQQQPCLTCINKLIKIRRLHSDLERIQMLLVEGIRDLQGLVRNGNAQVVNQSSTGSTCGIDEEDKEKTFSDVGKEDIEKLLGFQERVILNAQSVCRIPLVFLDVVRDPSIVPISGVVAVHVNDMDIKPLPLGGGVAKISVSTEDMLRGGISRRRRPGRPRKRPLLPQSEETSTSGRKRLGARPVVKKEPEDCLTIGMEEELPVDFMEPHDHQDIEDSDWNPGLDDVVLPEQGQDDDDNRDAEDEDEEYHPPVKRGVGRPRKHFKDPNAPKRPVGRPRTGLERTRRVRKVTSPKRRGGLVGRPKNPDSWSHKKNFRLNKRQLKKEPLVRKKVHHNIFRCELCSKVYLKRSAFLKHGLAHQERGDAGAELDSTLNNDETKECLVCRESFHASDYYEHLLTHEGPSIGNEDDKPFPCTHTDCIRKFRLEENLKIHMDIDHSELNSRSLVKVKKCDVCDMCYDTSNDLLAHFKRVHNEHWKSHQLVYCPVCGHSFTSQDNLIIHMHSHNTVEQQICFLCPSKFPNRQELLKHLQEFHSIQISKNCEICNEHFEDMYWCIAHLRNVHKRKETFICSICGKSCYFPMTFMKHYRAHNSTKAAGIPCPDCPERFANQDKLSNHRVRIHGDPKIPCVICGREYMNQTRWEEHQKEHTKEGFHCAICDKYYSNKGKLYYHTVNKHSDEKPYTCETCGYSTKTRHQLNKHRNTHLKKFHCEICGRRFSRQIEKRAHMTMHTGETIVCQFCGYELHSKKSLKRHVQNYHTGENPLPLYSNRKRMSPRCKWKDADGNFVYAKYAQTTPTAELSNSNPVSSSSTSQSQQLDQDVKNERLSQSAKEEILSQPEQLSFENMITGNVLANPVPELNMVMEEILPGGNSSSQSQ